MLLSELIIPERTHTYHMLRVVGSASDSIKELSGMCKMAPLRLWNTYTYCD